MSLPQPQSDVLLGVEDLRVSFRTDDGLVQAVRGVSFDLRRGETLGIVGESGSGKSVTNLALMGLIPKPPGVIEGGHAWYEGEDLLAMSDSRLQRIRGRKISMIFQDPMTALNPLMTVEQQLTEMTRLHLSLNKTDARRRAIEMLELVGISGAEKRLRDYPHQFSGGMRQRVMIAMALSCEPDVLIADEPTTALDVTIQAQILELLREIQQRRGTSIIMITHDLGVVAGVCDRVMVMYAGRVVENSDVEGLFAAPEHPYTIGLLNSLPRADETRADETRTDETWADETRADESNATRLNAIPGQPPDMTDVPSGCSFRARCDFAIDRCERDDPVLVQIGESRQSACWMDVKAGKPRAPEVAS